MRVHAERKILVGVKMAKLRIEAMPRRPKLPEGVVWEVTNPGFYRFRYPWPGGRWAMVSMWQKQDDYREDNTGPWRWFWSIEGHPNIFDGEGPVFDPSSWSDVQSDGGWPTLEGCFATVWALLIEAEQEISEFDRVRQIEEYDGR